MTQLSSPGRVEKRDAILSVWCVGFRISEKIERRLRMRENLNHSEGNDAPSSGNFTEPSSTDFLMKKKRELTLCSELRKGNMRGAGETQKKGYLTN